MAEAAIDIALRMKDQATQPVKRALAEIGAQARTVGDTFGKATGALKLFGAVLGAESFNAAARKFALLVATSDELAPKLQKIGDEWDTLIRKIAGTAAKSDFGGNLLDAVSESIQYLDKHLPNVANRIGANFANIRANISDILYWWNRVQYQMGGFSGADKEQRRIQMETAAQMRDEALGQQQDYLSGRAQVTIGSGRAAPVPGRGGAAGDARGKFFEAPESQWSKSLEAKEGLALIRVLTGLRFEKKGKGSGFEGYNAEAVADYWDTMAAAANRKQAFQGYNAEAVVDYWDQMAAEASRASAFGGYNAEAVIDYWDRMAAAADQAKPFQGYNAQAVADYWDAMAAAADQKLDAESVTAYKDAWGALAQTIGGASQAMYQFFDAGGRKSANLFRAFQVLSIAESVINTSLAITNVLASPWAKLHPDFGLGMAFAIGGVGAAQTALIAAQQVPALAEGGIVTRPTVALIGERGPEAVIPLGRSAGNVSIVVNVPVQGSVDERLLPVIHTVARSAAVQALREAKREDPRLFRGGR